MTHPEFDLDHLSSRDKRLARAAVERATMKTDYIGYTAARLVCNVAEGLWQPTKTIPTVRQGPSGAWFRSGVTPSGWHFVSRYDSRSNAYSNTAPLSGWHWTDRDTIADLIQAPPTEEVPE